MHDRASCPGTGRRGGAAAPVGVDLFCGAGGMTLGFLDAGFDVRAAVDVLPQNAFVHRGNFPECVTLEADVRELTGPELRRRSDLVDVPVDVVFGGPPCQGFSVGGRRAADDIRNALLLEFARLVVELQPKYFVLENVTGLLTTGQQLVTDFIAFVKRFDYNVVEPIVSLEASEFGVPQRRRRAFILGHLRSLPPPSYPKPPDRQCPTVWDAISDLPRVQDYAYLLHDHRFRGELGSASAYAARLRQPSTWRQQTSAADLLGGCLRTVHSGDVVARFRATKPGQREPISRFLRLMKEGLAPTLRAGSGSQYGSFTAPRPIHPTSHRCITVREAARLHSIPDWFQLHSTVWHGFSQVGNAVPPLLAQAVANEIQAAIADSLVRDGDMVS